MPFTKLTNLYLCGNKAEKAVTDEEAAISKLPLNLMTTQKQIIFYPPCPHLACSFY